MHNTLWIVGHFHQMALLNIGLLIFAAIYAFLPDLVGKPLYSESLGEVAHLADVPRRRRCIPRSG